MATRKKAGAGDTPALHHIGPTGRGRSKAETSSEQPSAAPVDVQPCAGTPPAGRGLPKRNPRLPEPVGTIVTQSIVLVDDEGNPRMDLFCYDGKPAIRLFYADGKTAACLQVCQGGTGEQVSLTLSTGDLEESLIFLSLDRATGLPVIHKRDYMPPGRRPKPTLQDLRKAVEVLGCA